MSQDEPCVRWVVCSMQVEQLENKLKELLEDRNHLMFQDEPCVRWVACCSQVEQLENKLKELEEDRKELARFQQVDRQRRSLEYTIYDKEVTDTTAKLEQVRPCRAGFSLYVTTVHMTIWDLHAVVVIRLVAIPSSGNDLALKLQQARPGSSGSHFSQGMCMRLGIMQIK